MDTLSLSDGPKAVGNFAYGKRRFTLEVSWSTRETLDEHIAKLICTFWRYQFSNKNRLTILYSS